MIIMINKWVLLRTEAEDGAVSEAEEGVEVAEEGDGVETIITTIGTIPGDITILEAGTIIPAGITTIPVGTTIIPAGTTIPVGITTVGIATIPVGKAIKIGIIIIIQEEAETVGDEDGILTGTVRDGAETQIGIPKDEAETRTGIPRDGAGVQIGTLRDGEETKIGIIRIVKEPEMNMKNPRTAILETTEILQNNLRTQHLAQMIKHPK